MGQLLIQEERQNVFVTPTYNPIWFLQRLKFATVFALALLAATILLPASAIAQDTGLSFSKLAPPAKKFGIPRLGNISVWKDDMKAARQAYRRGDYKNARTFLNRALKKGNFLAAWYLGHIYRLGLGVPASNQLAFKHYRIAALEYEDNGLPPRAFLIVLDSLVRVADGYRQGLKSGGVKQDFDRAMRLYSKAARRGHPGAQFGLAVMFLRGQSVKKNNQKTVQWMTLAARKKFPPALAKLGEFSLNGKLGKASKIQAVAMYIVATKFAREELYPSIFDRHDQLSRNMSDADYRKAQEMANRWMARNIIRQETRRKKNIARPEKKSNGFFQAVKKVLSNN